MKIFVISDIHGSAQDLKTLLDIFTEQKGDLLVIAGDYLNHGPRNPLPQGYNTKECATLLNQYAQHLFCVKGNCDSEVDTMLLKFPFFTDFSELYITSELQGRRIFVHHGHIFTKENLKKQLPQGSLIISGHTHVASLTQEEGFYFLNPGSISLPKNADKVFTDEKTYALIETDESGITQISLKTLTGKQIKCLTL